MQTLRQMCAISVLTMALAISVFAGQIHSPGKADPPPPTPGETSTPPTSDLTTSIILTIIGLIP